MKLLVSLLFFGSDRSSRNVFKRFSNGLQCQYLFSQSKDTSKKSIKSTKSLLFLFLNILDSYQGYLYDFMMETVTFLK